MMMRGSSRGDFSTTPVSSKDGPLWTLDNFLVTCPLTLVSGAGEGEVVSKEVGKEERGAQG